MTAAALGLAARWVTFAAILATLGAVVFRLIVVPRAGVAADVAAASSRVAATLGLIATALVLPAALVRLGVQTAQMRFPDDPWLGIAARLVSSTSWGTTWMIQVATAIALIVVFALARRGGGTAPWAAAALFTLLISATPTLASHAMSANSSKPINIAADWLHVVAAGTWIGTLAVMFTAGFRSSAPPAMMRWLGAFSPVALVGAGTVVVSGSLTAFLRIRHLDMLFTTAYGRTLLVKLATVGIVALLGWVNWKRNTPAVAASGSSSILAGMRAELIAAAIVLVVTAILVTTSPPMETMQMP